MTVLVTGGAGYIGSHMVYELLDSGEHVVVLDNLSSGHRWAVAEGIPFVFGETGDQSLVTELIHDHHVTAIIHFAASAVVPESVRDPLAYYRNNTVNSRALIECAIQNDIRDFIFSSTAAVYGNPSVHSVNEEHPTSPINPYGWSKLMTEIMLRDAGRAHELRHVIFRYFNVAGSDPQRRTGQSTTGATHLIKIAAETALGQRPKLRVFGTDYPTPDGTCIRDYIHVSDLVRAHSAALQHLRSGGASLTLNCGYGRGFSVVDVIETMKRLAGVEFEVENAPRRVGDPAHLIAANTRIRATLGWKPRFDDLSTILSHALMWERELLSRQARRRDIDTNPCRVGE